MGPHPEAPVDVQKYIGSCLITQQPRSKRKSCPRNQQFPKDGGGRCSSGFMQNCSKSPVTSNFNHLTNYAWTGVPLISVARQTKNHLKARIQARTSGSQGKEYARVDSPDGCNLDDILPLSRLAIHAQGAPLILSPKDSDKSGKEIDVLSSPPLSFKGNDFYLGENGNGSCLYLPVTAVPDEGHSRSPHRERTLSSCYFLEDDSELSISRAVSSSPSQSDCISTTSEDSGTSENGLPRIIKPRKRRKKDRRITDGDTCETAGTIVTLKPYQPLCYRYGSSGSGSFKSYPKSARSQASDADNEATQKQGCYPYPPSTRCRCAYCVPPPSTFLTPPDSPVSEDSLMVVAARNESKFLNPSDISKAAFEDSVKGQNMLILTSSHPPQRPWITMADRGTSCSFTVMCYNILCDKYATRQMYGYCPNWALDWTYRKKNILQEIIHYKADIISLQEVETEQFYKFFLPELKGEGYDGIFSPKSRAKTMSENERKHVDGCAIFFKTHKFFLIRDHLVEFNQLAMANAEGSDDMLNRVMTKDNIGLAALLQTRVGAYDSKGDLPQGSQTLLVCTAHIHWDPEYSDVKLIQTMMLMHELKTFVDDILQKCTLPPSQKSDPNIVPLLLCGDFNSLPDSGVIEYLSSGRVSTSHIDFKEFVYKDCLSKLGSTSKSNEFTHPFQISRAYSDGIMPFTNYSYDFKGVIDYVFYSKLHMKVLGVLGAVDSNWLEENHIHGCPHPHVPSDHFPIVVELQLNNTISLHPPPPNGVSLHR